MVFEPRSTKNSGAALADQKLSCKPKIKHNDSLGVQKQEHILLFERFYLLARLGLDISSKFYENLLVLEMRV